MESRNRRRLRECGIPLDMCGPAHAFSIGPGGSPGAAHPLIRPEDWAAEIAAASAEESRFWASGSVPIELLVELPFWLMIPDCELSGSYGTTKAPALIRNQYVAVADGPCFLTSRSNHVYIGPAANLDLNDKVPKRVRELRAPVFHPMKTVVVFRPNSVEDAIQALLESPVDPECPTAAVRRVNRSFQYLQSLAYSHIPILNSLILSYRLASRDPFAYRVATWDVPTWFVRHNEELLRISLMPYHDNDGYPTTKEFTTGEPSLFCSAVPQAVETTTNTDIPPGMEEILDAQSLFYRGHLDDAVRSAVTAIEVAIEGQIKELLTSQGFSREQIHDRLKATWNDFDERVRDYERIRGTRIPGPVVSCIPYINGIRLKSELGWVRRLRHKIVHEGLRVAGGSRGTMLRALETMTWLFRWLSWSEGEAEDHSRNYIFFEAMRGLGVPKYPTDYRASGISVQPIPAGEGEAAVSCDVFRSQYFSSIEAHSSDIELFALISFEYLGIDLDDGPPVDDAVVVDRGDEGERQSGGRPR